MRDEEGADGRSGEVDPVTGLTPNREDADRVERAEGTGSTEGADGSDAPGEFGGERASKPAGLDETLAEEISALLDDGRTLIEAEIGFQKTRAILAGRRIGVTIALALVAVILLHLTLIALAVGLVIALEPLVTIWGAIAIVVGALLAGVIALALAARSIAGRISQLFSDEET